MQDVEFTIQDGKLFMLQTRNGKRTAAAALKFSMDMFKEKLIDWKTVVLRNPADQLDQLLAPIFDVAEVKKAKAIATGLPAGPGAASGRIYLNADRAASAAEKGEKVLLVRNETSPEDLRGMIAAEGILTARGGVSSHAALVARQMGKVCICGASALRIDYDKKTVSVDGQTFKEGQDFLSIDGTSGTVYAGQLATAPSEIITGMLHGDKAAQKTEKFKAFNQLMAWCSKLARLDVRCNADNPEQTENALAFGAVGIGLTRTEHMFFEGNRIDAMREMILAANTEDRKKRSPSCFRISATISPASSKHSAASPPRSVFSIPRSTSFCRTARSSRWISPRRSGSKSNSFSSGSRNSTSSIRCSGIAAAGSASPTRRLPRCRRARSSRLLPRL